MWTHAGRFGACPIDEGRMSRDVLPTSEPPDATLPPPSTHRGRASDGTLPHSPASPAPASSPANSAGDGPPQGDLLDPTIGYERAPRELAGTVPLSAPAPTGLTAADTELARS